MKNNSQLTLQEMMDRGPQWLDQYLRKFELGELALNNCLIGILDGAASQAYRLSSIEWAGIAIRAAELMAENETDREFALQRAMRIRASFISKMGSRHGDVVLDKETIIGWFKSEAKPPIQVARECSERWKDQSLPLDRRLPLEQLRELRSLRHRIRVLQTLAECGELPDVPMLREWLEICDLLP